MQSVRIQTETLKAYNLTVADWHSYFVRGADGQSEGVWVSNTCLTQSSHARQRKLEGRNVGTAVNDLQRVRNADIYMQNDGRYVVRGKNGREHIIEASGEVVTTINDRSNKAHLGRLSNGTIRPATQSEIEYLKSFVEQ